MSKYNTKTPKTPESPIKTKVKMRKFIKYLRDTAQIRSAAVVVAVEDARSLPNGGREFIDAAAVKKGVSDAASRVYNEVRFPQPGDSIL